MNAPFLPPAADDGLQPARFTAAQFIRMGELGAFEDMKVELADGEIVQVSPPGISHARMQARIIILLATALSGAAVDVMGEAGVVLTPERVRGFDAVVCAPTPSGIAKRLAPEDVYLAIEIADATLERDLFVKAREYAEAGIPRYWVVDLDAGVTHVHTRPGSQGYGAREVVRFAEPLALPGTDATITLAP